LVLLVPLLQAKADKRLRDFQDKYKDITSKRKVQVGGRVVLQGGKAWGGCFVAGRPLLAEGRSAAAEAGAAADLTWPWPGPP
jgi:hypothetical protein